MEVLIEYVSLVELQIKKTVLFFFIVLYAWIGLNFINELNFQTLLSNLISVILLELDKNLLHNCVYSPGAVIKYFPSKFLVKSIAENWENLLDPILWKIIISAFVFLIKWCIWLELNKAWAQVLWILYLVFCIILNSVTQVEYPKVSSHFHSFNFLSKFISLKEMNFLKSL